MTRDHCDHLDEILSAETDLIQKHINEHKWYLGERKHRPVSTDEAIVDFVDKYAWIMREFYCSRVCKVRYNCELAKVYNPK